MHGPVGSAKSTIARLLKKGLEAFARTPDGVLYTYRWKVPDGLDQGSHPCPMHEEPLHLVPPDSRDKLMAELKQEVGRLVVETTCKVTGKVLSAEDQQRLIEDANKEIAA